MTGKELQAIIIRSGKTQKELAEKLGMHPTQWRTYFGQDDIKSGIIEKVAGLLGVTMAEMYGEEGSQGDSRLMEMIQSRDRQLDKSQEQIDRLIRIIEKMKQ